MKRKIWSILWHSPASPIWKTGITADDFYNGQESQIPEDSLPVIFRYRLSGGRTVLRQYAVEREKISETLTQLMEDNEYRKDLFPVIPY